MSEFKFSCPGCAQHLECDDAYSGDAINCPHCRQLFIVPQSFESLPALDPDAPAGQSESEGVVTTAGPPSFAGARKPSKVIWLFAGGIAGLAIGGIGTLFFADALAHRSGTNPAAITAKETPGPDAPAILRQVTEFYQGLNTFTAADHQETVVDTAAVDVDKLAAIGGMSRARQAMPELSRHGRPVIIDCDLALAKPGFYRITWVQSMGANVIQRGGVWSSGQGDFVYHWPANTYFKASDKASALAAVPGFMGIVVNAFFGLPENRIHSLARPARVKDETLDDRECYVLSGTLDGDRVILWVAKADFQIVRVKMVVGGLPLNFSDEEIIHSIKSAGKKVTPETIAAMREAVNAMSSIKGSFTESYQHGRANQPTGERAFIFDLPKGAIYLTEKP